MRPSRQHIPIDVAAHKVSGDIRRLELLTVKEVAALLRISLSKLYGWLESGKFPVPRINVNQGMTPKPSYRFELKDIQQFLFDRKIVDQSMDERIDEFRPPDIRPS
jgi:excisionase family DNA binding protein